MKLIPIFFVLFFSTASFAYPVATQPRPLFPSITAIDYDFEGIVALSNCSGSLIKFEGQPDTSQAYVLSNGHCYEGGFLENGKFLHNKNSTRRFTLMKPDGSDSGRITANKVVYATMTYTDVTLYRVNETYAEILQRYNIRPLTLASTHPTAQEPIEIISGYWRRGYSCNIDTFIYKLLEGGWENHDSIRYTNPGCEVIGGTSGSPILAKGTRTQIAINNTGNEDGGRCGINNPCEVNEKGDVFYQQGLNYGQQTYWFYSCLNAQFDIDLSIAGCMLHH